MSDKQYKRMEMRAYLELVGMYRKMNKRYKEQATNSDVPIEERTLVIDTRNCLSGVLSGVYDERRHDEEYPSI